MVAGRIGVAWVLSAAILLPSHWCCAFGLGERPCCSRNESSQRAKKQSCCAAPARRSFSPSNADRLCGFQTDPGRKPVAACCVVKPPAIPIRPVRNGDPVPQLCLFAASQLPVKVLAANCGLIAKANPPPFRGKLQPQLCSWRC